MIGQSNHVTCWSHWFPQNTWTMTSRTTAVMRRRCVATTHRLDTQTHCLHVHLPLGCHSTVCVCALQMVWADTHRVGCAVHLCNSMEGLSWEKASFLVCNYYPASVLQQHHCCIPTVTTSSAAFILNSRVADTASLFTAP